MNIKVEVESFNCLTNFCTFYFTVFFLFVHFKHEYSTVLHPYVHQCYQYINTVGIYVLRHGRCDCDLHYWILKSSFIFIIIHWMRWHAQCGVCWDATIDVIDTLLTYRWTTTTSRDDRPGYLLGRPPPLPPLGHIRDVMLVWRNVNINKNCLCVTVLCTIIMVHKDTSSSYRSVDCIGLWSCLV